MRGVRGSGDVTNLLVLLVLRVRLYQRFRSLDVLDCDTDVPALSQSCLSRRHHGQRITLQKNSFKSSNLKLVYSFLF